MENFIFFAVQETHDWKVCQNVFKNFYYLTDVKTIGLSLLWVCYSTQSRESWNEQKRDHWGAVNASKNETIEARQPVLKLDLSLHARQGF